MKKVLIITYYWPPAGGPGVQRVLKFAKYLPQFGWEPIILTVENGDYPATDTSLIDEIPENIKIYKTKTLEPFSLFKFFSGQRKEDRIPTFILNKNEKDSFFTKLSKWIRANFFIPDARIGWKFFAVKKGLEIIKNENIDLIFSSSPPQTVQLIGLELKKRTNLPWVADFRDPWTDAFWIKDLKRTSWAIKKDALLEKKVLNNADQVISVSKSLVNLFKLKNNNNYHIIPNGYDEFDFVNKSYTKSEKLTILYVGYADITQYSAKFFEAISNLSTDELNCISIEFYGKLHTTIIEKIKLLKLNNVINFFNYIPHNEAIIKIINADVLLLFIPNIINNEGILTGKLFEYLASENYILGFGPSKGDAAQIIRECNSGKMFDYDTNVLSELKFLINEKINNRRIISPIQEQIALYSREKLTEQLAIYFEELLNE